MDKAYMEEDSENIDQLYDDLPKFINDFSSMTKFEVYGDRKEYPYLTDDEWQKVGWDSLQNCFSCEKRHRCGQTLSRDHYRKAQDIIVCSHDFFMEHIWTKEARKREGQLPLLPEYSTVIFDEGHLLEFSAQKGLTYRIAQDTLYEVLTALLANDMREETLLLIEDCIHDNEDFFKRLQDGSHHIKGSHRYEITSPKLIQQKADHLRKRIDSILEALVFEAELYTIDEYTLKGSEEFLEQISYSLSLFSNGQNAVVWLEKADMKNVLVIMPRLVSDILGQEVFSKKMPYVFSSATLSEEGSFDYIANSLGIKDYLSFSVDSPFDYDEVMKVQLAFADHREKAVINLMRENNGSTLVLFPSLEEMEQFKLAVSSEQFSFPIYFEGDEEMSKTVKRFQNEQHSVLCSYHLWEGLDVPGDALTKVVIYNLPYPPNDPVFQAKRDAFEQPFEEVDLPYMLLRLRQGIGRLIRTSSDHGTIHLFVDRDTSKEVLQHIENILPVKPEVAK